MKRHEVTPGGVYVMTVKGQPVQVRIEAARSNGGWDATNLSSGKAIRLKSHHGLKPNPDDAGGAAIEGAESKLVPSVRKTKAAKADAPPARKKLSAIDAAAKVLGETGTPMNTKQMIEAMTANGYWTSPSGKTPAQTLFSAILREIAAKRESARFTKTERGTFAVRMILEANSVKPSEALVSAVVRVRGERFHYASSWRTSGIGTIPLVQHWLF